MKYVIKRTFVVTLALCFILAFSFSAGAVDAIGDVIGNLDKGESGNLIEYDYITKTKRIIPLDSIPDYASMTKTTYELEGMASELTRLAEMSTGISIDTGSGVSPLYLDPSKPYEMTPPKVNGVPVDPYSGVMLLQMKGTYTAPGGELPFESRGTGFLVAPDVLVTAGHCMDKIEVDGYPATITEMRVYPYVHSYTKPPLFYETYYVHPASWTCYDYSSALRDETKDQKNYDWCVIKLQQPITDAYNFACSTNASEVLNQEISLSGYPMCIDVNCTDEFCDSRNGYQVTSKGNIIDTTQYHIYYTNNAGPGSSGGPVYSTHTKICYAIETYGPSAYNVGNRITSTVYNVISYYINQ